MTYSIDIHIFEPTDPRLGRHVHHDVRNRDYAYTAPAQTFSPVRHHSNLPITDQGNVGACVGFSEVDLLGYDLYWNALDSDQRNHLSDDPNKRGLEFYSLTTRLDSVPGSYPPDDTGSDGPSGAKALQKLGYTNGYRHSFSFASFMTALQKGPVMVGTTWYESMMEPDSQGRVTVDVRSGVAGGHEYVADEYTAGGDLGFRNHWREDWGAAGRFYIPAPTFASLLADHGDATVPTPLTAPAPTPTPAPAPSLDADVVAAYQALKRWAQRSGA